MIVLEGGVATPLTEQMAQHLNVPAFYATLDIFPAQEWSVHMDATHLLNQHVIMVYGMHTPTSHQPLSGRPHQKISLHDGLMASLCIARKAKQQGAQTITMLCPFMPYGRQNKEGIFSFRSLFFDMMRISGIDRVMTLDMHDDTTCTHPFLFCLHSIPLWKPFFQNASNLTVVATDKGGQERARVLAQALGTQTEPLFLQKHRHADGSCTITPPNINMYPKKRHFLILDDILDTGSTLNQVLHVLKDDSHLSVCITHGLWSNNCAEKIKNANIQKIMVSDSIACHIPLPQNVQVVPCAPLLAQHILKDLFYRSTLPPHTS